MFHLNPITHHFIRLLLCVPLLFVFSSCHSGNNDRYVGGIQVNEASQEQWTRALKTNGLNTVSLTVYAYQGDWDGTSLRFKHSNPGIIEELKAAKAAGLRTVLIVRMGLDSAVPRNEFLWHGMILPTADRQLDGWFKNYGDFVLKWATVAQEYEVDVFGIGSELTALTSTVPVAEIPELEAYHLSAETQAKELEELQRNKKKLSNHELASSIRKFDSFEAFFLAKKKALREWAKQVTFYKGSNESVEARVAAINSHRDKLDTRWRKLITRVRDVYDGKLTYAAGFDQYQAVGFWDALDIIGINAYFKLREVSDAATSHEELKSVLFKSWKRVFEEIETLREEKQLASHPVLFTEIGYTFRDNSTVYPWASESFDLVADGEQQEVLVWNKQGKNYVERLTALKALREALAEHGANFFAGLLYWKFSSHEYHEAVEPFVHILGSETDKEFTAELKRFVRR